MTTIEKIGKARLLRAGRCAAIFIAQIAVASAASNASAASCTTNWTLAWHYSFVGGSADGANPYAGLSGPDANGNLIGATFNGGAYGQGIVFSIPTSGGTPAIVHSFNSTLGEGAGPNGTPVLDKYGNILGTTVYSILSGGTGSGNGVVYEFKPDGSGGYNLVSPPLYSFAGGSDGANPYAGLSPTPDTSGNYYGTTQSGGASGDGTMFKLQYVNGSYSFVPYYSFAGGSLDGMAPYAGVIVDNGKIAGNANNIYGATAEGGSNNDGEVFEFLSGSLSPTPLHSFAFSSDGAFPFGSLVEDLSGNLYGTTYLGGASGSGTVFTLTWLGGRYSYMTLYNFQGSSTDGGNPYSSLVVDSAGNLYGTAFQGGASNQGVVFELAPNASGTYTYNNLYCFSGSDGANPYAGLLRDTAGNLYGTTVNGGARGYGVVFKLSPPVTTATAAATQRK